MLTAFNMSSLEKRIHDLYREKGFIQPCDITLHAFNEWVNIETIYRHGDTNNFELHNAYKIFIDPGKSLPERRIEMAHEIAHIVLHSGNQIQMALLARSKQEWQANRFAMYALVPSLMLIREIGTNDVDQTFTSELAFIFGVTCQFMIERLKLLKEDMIL